ncbi:MAG TPA: hypothetical protein VGT40_09875 [Methylomirabilota bacterium]|jgi:hypothetical protein|nr:hypothetical protein [Methylomirabilota bacterium]
MPDPAVLERLVSEVARQIRLRRAEYYGLRGLLVGALAALPPLCLRELLGGLGLGLAGGLLVAGALGGALYGLLLRLPPREAARLADRGYGLQDRVATALEWATRPERTPIVEALLADAVFRAEHLQARRIIPRRLPREARFVPLPLVAGALLAVAPSIPLPQGSLPNFSVSREEEEEKPRDRAGELETAERPKLNKRDSVQRAEMQERNLMPRLGGGGQSQPGDLSAIFKDTSLGGKAPDFNSFLKKGDERIRMLEQVDRLPDLQQDYTQRQTKVIFQRAKALRGGLDPSKVSPEKLRELLNEMERLGRKGGPNNWTGDVFEGMEALEGGQNDKALEAMERALSKMRSMEEKGRDGKSLRGGRENDRRGAQRGRDRGAGQQGGPGDEGDFPEGEGLLPGRGKSPNPKGDPTQRLRGSPYDVGVEGETRAGRKQGIDTNMIGRGSSMPSRLQYLSVLGQYRKMMEESIAREQVPRDFQTQVKEYFQSLDEK